MRTLALALHASGLASTMLLSVAASAQQTVHDEARHGPLPRWREGGTPVEDHSLPLVPFAVRGQGANALRTPPTSGLMESPPEYSPAKGVLFRYLNPWQSVVVDCVAALTGDAAHDDIAYVVVSSNAQMNTASNAFLAAGADLSKVQFIIKATDSIWLRDYGPHFVWQSGTRVVADSHYYPSRPTDNFIPTRVAEDTFVEPAYAMGLYYSGGNFQPGPDRSGFVTSLVQQDNSDLSVQQIADLYSAYQGIDTLHILPRLPSSVDGTGHIDMWMYLIDEDTVIISEFLPGSNATAIQITNDAVPYMENLGFMVHRPPAWNVGFTHYTYANAFRVNDRIFVPIYGPGNANYLDDDADALAVWEAAAGPSVEIVPIDCYDIIPAAGAIHCIVMQVPLYTDTLPSAHVLSPAGGEVLAWGEKHDVTWSSTDDGSVTSIDLLFSTDGGLTFPETIATGLADSGRYSWTVPSSLASDEARVKVVAHDDATNSVEAVSAADFQVREGIRRVHDFSSGAGVDEWGWGYQTSSWAQVDGQRYPASIATPIESLAAGVFAALAVSDAVGGDSDTARYRSLTPSASFESSHVFEFRIDEPVGRLIDMELLWEGYGDECLQVELYVWDRVTGNWADARGGFGANAYLANWAGNVDGRLSAHVTDDFHRYIDPDGVLTLLVYAERSQQETFHDYVAVITTSMPGPGTHHLPLPSPGAERSANWP
jgi:agmatine/peptidylarginine deiminase